MIGPKTLPMPRRAAPLDDEQPTRITIAIGMTQSSNADVATSKPSTALSTEIAGVISPSPYSSAVPNTPSVTTTAAIPLAVAPRASASRAR